MAFRFPILVILLAEALVTTPVTGQSPSGIAGRMAADVKSIVRADYEGDRAELLRRAQHLRTYLGERSLAGYSHYWRGFAFWRRALNGFNDAIPAPELDADLSECVAEFREARQLMPDPAEAFIGEAGCEMNRIYLSRRNPAGARVHVATWNELDQQLQKTAASNPRYLWIRGASLWSRPAAAGGGESEAIACYQLGLRLLQRHDGGDPSNDLDPLWGEPELLMSLAWSHQNGKRPDATVALRLANQALALVPNWHYVRDILIPDICRMPELLQLHLLERSVARP